MQKIDRPLLYLMRKFAKGMHNLSEEQNALLNECFELNGNLKALTYFKAQGDIEKCRQYERKLKYYEYLIDKKYWNGEALFVIIMAIGCGVAETIEQACEKYDIYKNLSKT